MSSTEQELRESLSPMIRDELMRTWREGMQAGLKMAHNMAEAVRDEAARRVGDASNDCERAELEAQIAALGGLMSGLLDTADRAVTELGTST